MTSTVTAKGQTTVPKEVRDFLKLKPGAKVKWFFHPRGGVVMLPTLPAGSSAGMVKYTGPPVSIEDMDPANFGRLRVRRKEAQSL